MIYILTISIWLIIIVKGTIQYAMITIPPLMPPLCLGYELKNKHYEKAHAHSQNFQVVCAKVSLTRC